MPSRATAFIVSALLVSLAHSTSAADCDAVDEPCCAADAPDRPSSSNPNLPFCKTDDLICFKDACVGNGCTPTCRPFPKDCGATGSQCCPSGYHAQPDKKLPPMCADKDAICLDYAGDGTTVSGKCVVNDPDCGADGKPCCWKSSGFAYKCECKKGLMIVGGGVCGNLKG